MCHGPLTAVFLKRRLPLRRRVPPRMLASSSSTSVPSSPERRVSSHSSATGWTCIRSTALESIQDLGHEEERRAGPGWNNSRKYDVPFNVKPATTAASEPRADHSHRITDGGFRVRWDIHTILLTCQKTMKRILQQQENGFHNCKVL